MGTIIGFLLIAIALLDIANSRQLARYFDDPPFAFRSTARQNLVIVGMIVFCAGVAVIVLTHI
jgi:hypothetical protein